MSYRAFGCKVALVIGGGVSATGGVAASQAASVSPTSNEGEYIVVFKDGTEGPDGAAARHSQKYGVEREHLYRHALKGYSAKVPRNKISALEADPAVLFVAPNIAFTAPPPRGTIRCEGLTTPEQCLPDGINRVDGDLSSTRSGDGRGSVSGVNVAVIDSGIDIDHADLNVAGGADCSDGKRGVRPGLGYDDALGHGTFVAGVVGARDNAIGVVGVAPDVRLWAVGVAAKKGPTLKNILCGVDWVTSTRMDSDPTNDVAVANISIGAGGRDDGACGASAKDALHVAICRSVAAGVTYAVSAGNDGVDIARQIPAAYDEVLAVTAMADFNGVPGGGEPAECWGEDFSAFAADDEAATFSNFATLPEDRQHTIAAPGVCIDSTVPGGYSVADGTSFSSPHVAGMAALCIATKKCSGSPAQIMETLITDAATYNNANSTYGFVGDPLRPVGSQYFGYLVRAAQY